MGTLPLLGLRELTSVSIRTPEQLLQTWVGLVHWVACLVLSCRASLVVLLAEAVEVAELLAVLLSVQLSRILACLIRNFTRLDPSTLIR
ncbi:hypothetical protein D3C80_234990 [compost metagenome]